MAKAKRQQIKVEPIFSTEDEAKEAIREKCEIKIRLDGLENEYQQKLVELREEYDQMMEADKSRDARLDQDLCDFYTYFRETIFTGSKKSIDYTHGTVGFRTHPPALKTAPRVTIAAALENIREICPDKIESYIRTKEELNKDILLSVPEEELAKIGLKIEQKETFGITLNLESLQATS